MLPPALGGSTPGHGDSANDWRQALKLWNYCCRLAKYLLDEGLLDRHDFLTWVIDLLDKRGADDGLLRLVARPNPSLTTKRVYGKNLLGATRTRTQRVPALDVHQKCVGFCRNYAVN